MSKQTIRTKLDTGESVFGYFTPTPDLAQAEILARSGCDFLVFDGEHGHIEPGDMAPLSAACSPFGCDSLMRIASKDERSIGRPLDFGCTGIVAPMVNSGIEAQYIVDCCLYPPQGKRGLALTRSLAFGQVPDVPGAMVSANEAVFTIAQIETREAIEKIDDILGIDRLDLVFVGPADLSVSLGCPLQFDHPDFLAAMMQISAAVKESQKHLGVLIAEPQQVRMLHTLGFRLFATYLDGLLMASALRHSKACADQLTAQ